MSIQPEDGCFRPIPLLKENRKHVHAVSRDDLDVVVPLEPLPRHVSDLRADLDGLDPRKVILDPVQCLPVPNTCLVELLCACLSLVVEDVLDLLVRRESLVLLVLVPLRQPLVIASFVPPLIGEVELRFQRQRPLLRRVHQREDALVRHGIVRAISQHLQVKVHSMVDLAMCLKDPRKLHKVLHPPLHVELLAAPQLLCIQELSFLIVVLDRELIAIRRLCKG
mmetsp:Transcript_21701/g.71792  ORF Transcript_21701/g.71792 Transcript_21701/m.71792 type:complete len:223 (+) Transcript_21701:625-1293(+)